MEEDRKRREEMKVVKKKATKKGGKKGNKKNSASDELWLSLLLHFSHIFKRNFLTNLFSSFAKLITNLFI